jgi:hypothetical protein
MKGSLVYPSLCTRPSERQRVEGAERQKTPNEIAKSMSAPTITITDTSRTVNRGVVTGKVPAEAGTVFFFARLPAMAAWE